MVTSLGEPGDSASVDPEQRLGNPSVISRLVRAPEFGAAAAAILIYGFFSITSSGRLLTLDATAGWLDTAAYLGIIAVPVGMLMIAGEFDLSIGSMVGAGSISVGVITGALNQPLPLAVGFAFLFAIAIGVCNGLLVTRTGLPSFIVTLGTNLVVAALALTLSRQLANTTTITVYTSGLLSQLFSSQWKSFGISILWWVLILVIAAWVLRYTRFGNWILATGGDAERARRAGVMTSRVKIILFVCTALAATLVGVSQAVQYNTGDAVGGQGYVFQAPIVVVIGGVLLTGGYGTMLGVALGTAIYGVADAGLFYTGWNTDWAQGVTGSLLILTVLTNNSLRRLAVSALKPE